MAPRLTLKALPAISLTLLHFSLATLAAPGGSCNFSKRANGTGSETEIWGGITPSKDLVWHSCYADPFECARLEVPLDYSDPDGGKAAIALIRRPATTQEGYRGPVLLNPGGPGGSGVSMVLATGEALGTIIGPQFDVVSFDPRGIGRSTPRASFFDTDVERTLFATGAGTNPLIKDGIVSGVERVWAQSQLMGTLAASHNDGYLQHITTENTATDMLRIVQAHGQEKLQYWGFSYGTVLGATFAAMYPDKVERMVIDGVVDADDYYTTAWFNSLEDSEKTFQLFSDNCAEAGPTNCPFYAADPSDIQRNITALQDRLLAEPVIVKTDKFYGIVDHTTLRFMLFRSLYSPYLFYQPLANALAQLAAGNGTALYSMMGEPIPYQCSCDEHEHDFAEVAEAFSAVACNDGAEVPGSLKELRDYWNKLAGVYQFADYWGTIRAGCINWPKNKKPFHGPFVANTSHPILLIGNTADPVTPLSSAKKMAKGFKDSVVLTIDAGGHCSLYAPSVCASQYVQQYFQNGTLPEEGTVCEPIAKNSFLIPASELSGGSSVVERGLAGDDTKLLAAVQDVAGKFGSGFNFPGLSGRSL